jgi:hypothetical protein
VPTRAPPRATPITAAAPKRAPKTPAPAAAAAAADATAAAAGWAGARGWVLTASGLDAHQKTALRELAAAAGARYEREWSPAVTHVVASVDGSGRAKRTMKYLCALLEGQWVVGPAWVAACAAKGSPAPEAAHQARGDDRGAACDGAPAAARARAAAGGEPLFAPLRVHLAGDFGAPSRAELEALVRAGGGRVLRLAPSPPSPGQPHDPGLRVVCGGARAGAAEAAACATGAPALAHAWLLDCVAQGALLPTQSYTLADSPAS